MADDEITIQAARPEDAPAIHAMLRALSTALDREDELQSSPEDIARYGFGGTPAFETIIARRGGEPVGLALFFFEFSTWRGRPGVYVQDLYVAAGMRGTGTGRGLLAAVAERAAARGAVYMRLSIHSGNAEGAGFYERLGFEASNEKILVLEGAGFSALGSEAVHE
ncbi:MAG: GNAT family N-acetyltransferase [Arenicellales bacterium]